MSASRKGKPGASPGGKAAAGGADAPALQTPEQVRAVAQLLSDAADAYNQRLKAEAARLSSGEVFARLQEEQRLRGVANQLFFEAAARTLESAVDAQSALEATLREASARLARFEHFAHVLQLVADLLVLGGAIVARKAPTVIAALKEVRKDLAPPAA